MKALKKKWNESQEADLLKEAPEIKPMISKPKLNKGVMESSTISFEKIPLISKNNAAAKEVSVVKMDTIYSIDETGKVK